MGFIAAALAGAMVPAPAFADADPGLAFAQEGTLSLSWDTLESGEEVIICNGGSQAAKPLAIRLAGFGFKHADQASEEETKYPPGEVLAVTAPPEGIPPGACDVVSLALVDAGLAVDAGAYTGSLVVAASGLGVAQLPLTVSGPGTVTKAAAVKGAVEQATLEAENSSPWSDPHLTEDSELLLKLPATGEKPLAIGDGCEQLKDGWNDKCPFIGNLYQGSDILGVHVAGKVVEAEGVTRLPIRISGSHAVGDYEGVLDPSLTGEAEQAVKTKLTATDSACWPIAALLLGTAIALVIQLWSGRWRPKYLLNRRKDDLVDSYVKARKEVNGRDGELRAGRKFTIKLDKPAVEAYAGEVKNAIWRYSWSTLLLDTSSDAYKQIESSLTLAEEDRKLLAAKDGLQKGLVGLAAGVAKTETLLVQNHLVAEVPELLTRARALLEERKFGVGDAIARVKKAGELTASLESWRKLAERVLGDEAWLFALAKAAASGLPKPIEVDDKGILADLAMRLRAVHEELLLAGGDEDLGRLRVSGRIETAHGQLAYLAAKYEVGKPNAKAVVLLEEDLLDPVERAFEGAFESGSVDSTDLPDDRGEVLSEPASAVRLPKRKMRVVLFDSLVFLFAVGAAIFAGLTSFYLGKSFGTWQDYATVIVIGTVAQLIVVAILDKFSAFWHDIAPLTDLERAQVKVIPKSE